MSINFLFADLAQAGDLVLDLEEDLVLDLEEALVLDQVAGQGLGQVHALDLAVLVPDLAEVRLSFIIKSTSLLKMQIFCRV